MKNTKRFQLFCKFMILIISVTNISSISIICPNYPHRLSQENFEGYLQDKTECTLIHYISRSHGIEYKGHIYTRFSEKTKKVYFDFTGASTKGDKFTIKIYPDMIISAENPDDVFQKSHLNIKLAGDTSGEYALIALKSAPSAVTHTIKLIQNYKKSLENIYLNIIDLKTQLISSNTNNDGSFLTKLVARMCAGERECSVENKIEKQIDSKLQKFFKTIDYVYDEDYGHVLHETFCEYFTEYFKYSSEEAHTKLQKKLKSLGILKSEVE